jgi:tRNA threonylcarbamoyladenosine modification (KEOPS) complex  Pcc1 subunit
MNQTKPFTIESIIEFEFNKSHLRDISYNSFIPEMKKLQTNRSQVLMKKKNQHKLLFKVDSNDITAFRASINEIISFGKIIDNILQLPDIS